MERCRCELEGGCVSEKDSEYEGIDVVSMLMRLLGGSLHQNIVIAYICLDKKMSNKFGEGGFL